jgi:hypothetical protein
MTEQKANDKNENEMNPAAKMWKSRYEASIRFIAKLYQKMSNYHIDAEDIDKQIIETLGICPNHYVYPELEENYDLKDRICMCCQNCWKDPCECNRQCKLCKRYDEECTCETPSENDCDENEFKNE